jgi:radical SAM superfamily enzyme YgiQ (UPF0313 family)
MLMLQAWLRKRGVDARVQYMHEHENDLNRILESHVYGISLVTPNFAEGERLYRHVKKSFGKPVFAGGPHVSADPEHCVDRVCDVAFCGPGERNDLLELLEVGKKSAKALYSSWPCVVRADYVDVSEEYEGIRLDYGDIDASRYKTWLLATDVGCYNACRFCYKQNQGVARYPIDFVEQCVVDAKRFPGGRRMLKLTSDNVLRDTYTEAIGTIGEHGLSFEVCGRFDQMTKWTGCFLDRMGCAMIKFGMESGSDRVLELMNKRETAQQMMSGAEVCRDLGLRFGVYLMVGFPGEAEEDREATLRAVLEMRPDWYSVYKFVPYPGTKVWRDMSAEEKQSHRDNSFAGFNHAGTRESEDPVARELREKISEGLGR